MTKFKPFKKIINGRTLEMLPIGTPFMCEGELSCYVKIVDGNEQDHTIYSVVSIVRADGGIAP